jgi:hypothetical protein
VTVANTVAKPLDEARLLRTAVECLSSAATAIDGPGRCAYSYGSEGRVPDEAVDPCLRDRRNRRTEVIAWQANGFADQTRRDVGVSPPCHLRVASMPPSYARSH